MSEMKNYSVQVHYRMEVCVRARDEDEAEQVAKESSFDTSFLDLDDATAEEMYNDPEDRHLVDEFKREDRYAEA